MSIRLAGASAINGSPTLQPTELKGFVANTVAQDTIGTPPRGHVSTVKNQVWYIIGPRDDQLRYTKSECVAAVEASK